MPSQPKDDASAPVALAAELLCSALSASRSNLGVDHGYRNRMTLDVINITQRQVYGRQEAELEPDGDLRLKSVIATAGRCGVRYADPIGSSRAFGTSQWPELDSSRRKRMRGAAALRRTARCAAPRPGHDDTARNPHSRPAMISSACAPLTGRSAGNFRKSASPLTALSSSAQ
jgi:hypothetical protein